MKTTGWWKMRLNLNHSQSGLLGRQAGLAAISWSSALALPLLSLSVAGWHGFGHSGLWGQQISASTSLTTDVRSMEDIHPVEKVRLPGNWFENDAAPPVSPPPVPPPTREFNRTGINEITFDDVSFEILPGDPFDRGMLTENIRRLDGLKVRVRGFIRPSFKQTGIQKFVFVRDNQECCFGPGAAIYDCILVELGQGKTADFTVRPMTLVGTFYLDEYSGPDGNIWAIFRMRDAAVE